MKDGYSTKVIPAIKQKFGDEVFVVAFTGEFARHEGDLFRYGVDLALQKPYSPISILGTLDNERRRLEGMNRIAGTSSMLKIGEGYFDINSKVFFLGEDRTTLTDQQARFLKFLSENRGPDGWLPVDRGVLMAKIWGGEAIKESKAVGDRLRKLKQRLSRALDHPVVEVTRTQTHSSRYAFLEDIKFVSGDEHA